MNIKIIAHGKISKGPELELIQRYMKRYNQKLPKCNLNTLDIYENISEEKDYNRKLAQKQKEEKKYIIVDEKGVNITSLELANYLNTLSNSGIKDISIFIGGAHGLPEKIKENAIKSISFSNLVLPHKLIRVILVEQLYRAKCIISNHPYHKE
tara:strand:- start:186 stop:644 length:459 start_codon:yes stop_codon:yes gene_type:complete